MISDKVYNTITKTVDSIIKALNKNNIKHEIQGDMYTFALAPTCTIHTSLCTIDVWKDEIKVNEKIVSGIEEMISVVIEVEGT